jgi:glycosyltransferase involved in cell wall biosynthesis
MERPELSVIIPIFNESAVIDELRRRLAEVMDKLSATVRSWEVIFIDDGSRDASLSMLREMARLEPRFKVVAFARNFGHQLAITAGIDVAEGDAVVIMDADLQDPPEVVIEMIERWRSGFDVVYGVRKSRAGETLFKRLTAAGFYRVLKWMLGGISIPVDAGDFRLMARPVVLTLRALRERHRFVRGMVAWVGFKQSPLYYDREARFAGETKYPFSKMLRFAIDAITSFSILPLRMASYLGVGAALVAIVYALFVVYVKVFLGGVVQGWTTIMIAVALGTSAQLFMTGVLGEYVGRIYEEVKRRPLYITAELLNFPAAEVGPSSRHVRAPSTIHANDRS